MTTYIPKWIVGALCFVAVFVISMSWLLAAVCDPSWSIGNDTISHLGTSSVGATKFLFNIGFCVLGGFLVALVGALYLFTKKTRMIHIVYGILIVLSGIGLICVGLCPLDGDRALHGNVAIFAFLMAGILYFLTTIEVWQEKKHFVAGVFTSGIALALIIVLSDISMKSNLALVETIVVLYFLMMLVYYGIEWVTSKPEKVVSLYGDEVKA